MYASDILKNERHHQTLNPVTINKFSINIQNTNNLEITKKLSQHAEHNVPHVGGIVSATNVTGILECK